MIVSVMPRQTDLENTPSPQLYKNNEGIIVISGTPNLPDTRPYEAIILSPRPTLRPSNCGPRSLHPLDTLLSLSSNFFPLSISLFL